jgi:hypothetical protein
MSSQRDWERFPNCLADLGLTLRFPGTTNGGDSVIMDDFRAHVRSQRNDDVYFEISRHAWMSIEQVYEREKRGIETAGHRRITELSSTTFAGRAASQYRIEWSDGERSVVLVEHNGYVYRIVHNPRSEQTREVISTIGFH